MFAELGSRVPLAGRNPQGLEAGFFGGSALFRGLYRLGFRVQYYRFESLKELIVLFQWGLGCFR